MLDVLLGVRPARGGGWVSKNPADDYWYAPRASTTTAGVDIDEDKAMTITTVFACVSKVSKTVAGLPVEVVKKTGPRKREVVDHPLTELLTSAANTESTGLTLRESIQANLELWGNAYVAIDWNNDQTEPRQLTLLQSRDVEVGRDQDGELAYRWRNGSSQKERIPNDRMWHIPGLSLNGITGVSVVAYNREALGVKMAATQFGGAFFGNGAWMGGFIKRGQDAPEFSPEAAERFLESLNDKFRGAAKAFGFGLLREGMEFQQIDMPFEDAMFLGTHDFSRIEICGMFDVPAIMLHDNKHANYKNSEHADIHFAKHSILPRVLRIEHSAKRRFFLGTKLALKHNLAGLQRGDFPTQMEGFAKGRQWGLFSVNDCRALLDLEPVEGGDEYLTPLNMQPVGQPRPAQIPARPQNDDEDEPEEEDENANALAAVRPMVADAAQRIAAKEVKALERALKRRAKEDTPDGFKAWAEKFYGDHAPFVASALDPSVQAFERLAGVSVRPTALEMAEEYCDQCFDTLTALVDEPQGVVNVLWDWKENKAEGIARRLLGILTKGDSE